MKRISLLLFAVLLPVLLLGACASTDDGSAPDQPVDVLYRKAYADLMDGENKSAARGFDEVERQHPYSQWATRAKLMSAFASYRAGDYDAAVITLDDFIELHPGHPDVAYAYYLKGIAYYEQIVDVARDQDQTDKACAAFDEVIRRFPDTTYARDARFKEDLTRDHLAGKEMEIGRYYLKRGFYQAALNRFRVVVEQYQTTTHIDEALHRMVEASLALGMKDQAQKYAAILGHNHPDSEWYKASYSLLQQGKTLQLQQPKETPTTTAGRIANKITGLFE